MKSQNDMAEKHRCTKSSRIPSGYPGYGTAVTGQIVVAERTCARSMYISCGGVPPAGYRLSEARPKIPP